jgi:beta-lactamase regulating signal transducer with metallopeptidase domain
MQAFLSRLSVNLTLTLLHTLWQAALLAAVLYVFLRLVPARRASVRYVVSFCALLAVLLCALVTYNVLERRDSLAEVPPPSGMDASTEVNGAAGSKAATYEGTGRLSEAPASPTEQPTAAAGAERFGIIRRAFSRWLSRWSFWLAAVWLAGVLLMLVRSAVCLGGASRLRSAARPCTDAAVLRVLEEVRSALAVTRRVRLAVCALVKSPAVLGILRPVILVPSVVVTGMSPEQLRIVLAHELAHVRRHDYLANLVQVVIEALFFFNPALWWMSRQVRVEREACCDAAAVSLTGQAETVAEALADWAERLVPRYGEPTLAFSADRHNALLDRLGRLAFPSGRPSLRLPWYSLAAVLLSSAVLLAALGRGAGLAVNAAAKVFSHEERIERLAEIKTDYGDEETPGRLSEESVTVSPVVRTFDGKPLPEKTNLIVQSFARSGGYGIHVSLRSGGFPQVRHPAGQIYVAATAPGYAPAFAGPFLARSGENR